MSETFEEIIAKLWTTPERAEWIPKTDTVALSDVQRWMASNDIEILGFTYSLISNVRFRVEPPISLSEYVEFIKRYYERCLRENPDGEWSDSNYSAGVDLVNLFAALWRAPATALRWLYESETLSESLRELWSGLVRVESAAQPGSAAKAAFSLERSCPMESMAPVLAIV